MSAGSFVTQPMEIFHARRSSSTGERCRGEIYVDLHSQYPLGAWYVATAIRRKYLSTTSAEINCCRRESPFRGLLPLFSKTGATRMDRRRKPGKRNDRETSVDVATRALEATRRSRAKHDAREMIERANSRKSYCVPRKNIL